MLKRANVERIMYVFLIILMILLPAIRLASYNLQLNGVIREAYIVNSVYVLWGAIPILIILYIWGLVTKKYKFTYIDILFYILIVLAILSTIFAVDIKLSIYGEIKRNEGLLTIISYYLIFLNVKNITKREYKRNIIKVFLILGVFQAIYGILQVYTIMGTVKHYSRNHMAMGLCGNPNFFGSYMVMLTLISTTLFITKKEMKYLFLSILYFIGLFTANSTAPFLTYILTFVFGFFYCYRKVSFKYTLLIILAFSITFFAVDYTNKERQAKVFKATIEADYVIKDDIVKATKDVKNMGNGRFEVWRKTIPLIKDYWLVGSGLDTFAKIYTQDPYLIYDKAHNVYLQMAVTNGIPATVTYLLICFIAFLRGFKYKEPLQKAIYLAFIGYCIQAFANISVIEVAPYFFIILGLLFTFGKSQQKSLRDH